MARINIENSWWTSARREKLIELIGDSYVADGVMLRLWRLSQNYWAQDKSLIPLREFDLVKHARTTIEANLTKLEPNGAYVFGTDKHHSWLIERKEIAKKAGKKSAEKRKKANGTAQPKNKDLNQDRTTTESSCLDASVDKEILNNFNKPSNITRTKLNVSQHNSTNLESISSSNSFVDKENEVEAPCLDASVDKEILNDFNKPSNITRTKLNVSQHNSTNLESSGSNSSLDKKNEVEAPCLNFSASKKNINDFNKPSNITRTKSNQTQPSSSSSYSSSSSGSNSSVDKKNEKTRESGFRAQEFISTYCDKFKDLYDINPIITGKDAGIAKRLATALSLEQAGILLDAYFSMPDPFIRKSKHPMNLFELKLSEISVFAETGKFTTATKMRQNDYHETLVDQLRRIESGEL